MSQSYNQLVVKAFQNKSAEDILNAAPDALKGVSHNDAKLLQQAFGIDTVRELAQNPYFHRAMAVLAGSGAPGYDPGPPSEWENRFSKAPLAHYQQFPEEFRLDFGPVYYRGRLDGTARVIVVGQDPSVNEILAHRVFVGSSGQRLQGFLGKLGVTRSYLMINTFLYSINGQFTGKVKQLSAEDPILSYRNECLSALLDSNPVEAVIAVGLGAQDAVQRWPGHAQVPVVNITHPSARDAQALLANWNQGLQALRPIVHADDGAAVDNLDYGNAFTDADHNPIPRFDLPFGIPDWHGIGDHGERDGPKTILWQAP